MDVEGGCHNQFGVGSCHMPDGIEGCD